MEQPPTLNLQLHKLAREMEKELGGLFGIRHQDIEKALKRLHERVSLPESEEPAALPNLIDKTLPLLEIVYERAREACENGERQSLLYLIELLDNYRGRLERMLGDER